MMKIRLTHGLVVAAALVFTSCSSDTKASVETDLRSAATVIANAAGDATNAAAEALARNIATQQGEEQFKNAGKELDGPLTCEAKVQDGVDKIDINCTGKTKDGGAATLTGTTNELPGASVVSLNVDFTGAVDGTTVFTTQRLGG
jgi:predicted small secreted protein